MVEMKDSYKAETIRAVLVLLYASCGVLAVLTTLAALISMLRISIGPITAYLNPRISAGTPLWYCLLTYVFNWVLETHPQLQKDER